MRLIAFLFAVLCFASIAQAAPKHGIYVSGVSCPYSGDNGCTASTTYVTAPAFQDTAFAYNHATSGQLPTDCVSPTTCTVNTNAITNLKALWHTDNVNFPYWDYPIGSANPATLAAVNTINDGTCVYNATGSAYAGPAVVCQQTTASPAIESLSGYDFTNLGGGTGTGCAQLYVLGSNFAATSTGGAIAYQFTNNYHKAFGACFAGNNAQSSALIFFKSGGAYNASNAFFYNITCDGNYANAPDTNPDVFTGYIDNGAGAAGTKLNVVSLTSGTPIIPDILTGGTVSAGTFINGGTYAGANLTVYPSQLVGSVGSPVTFTGHKQNQTGRLNCIVDNRTANSAQNPKTILYSLMINFGHDPMVGSQGGDNTIKYSAFIDFCTTGGIMCHGEIFEDTGGNTTRSYDLTGNVVTVPSIQNVNLQTTTAFYLTSGAGNNSMGNNVYLRDNLVVQNKMNCSNAGPYTPSNPCGAIGNGGATQLSGNALFSMGLSFVNSFTVSGNVVDGTGAFFCINRLVGNPASLSGAVINVLSASQNLTFTTRPTNFTVPQFSIGVFPGMEVINTNATDIANGWVPSTIVTFTGATAPIFQTTGTLCTTGAGAPGQAGGAGCGSMLLSQVEPVTVAPLANWYLATGINAKAWSNNWSIGGAYGVSARSIADPGYTLWTQTTCP
jgi:hypothetical protein